MAKMIPDLDPGAIENAGERAVYAALRSELPDEWSVRYHYVACLRDGRFLRETEADFIVIAPGRGLLFLEVKGSRGLKCSGGQWYRECPDGSWEPARSPFDQVITLKHRIVKRIADSLSVAKENFPGVYGHAVIYPHGRLHGPLPPDIAPQTLITHDAMPDIHHRLEALYGEWGPVALMSRFSPQVAQNVRRLLEGDLGLVPLLGSELAQDDATIRDLTRQQYDALRGLMENPRVLIEGVAGSGKTVLASWTAERFAADGKRVLYLCYNRLLAEWLRRGRPEPLSHDVSSFHALCRHCVVQAALRFHPGGEDWWGTQAAMLFMDALDRLGPDAKYDAVIVDEAQDFHEDWWFPVEMLLRQPENGLLFVFRDPDQSGVFGNRPDGPAGMVRYKLTRNCRNTRLIAQYAAGVLGKPVETFPRAPMGVTPDIVHAVADLRARADLVIHGVRGWLNAGISRSGIAVLSPWQDDNPECSLTHVPPTAGFAITRDVREWGNGQAVFGGTVASFKGLEADCVLLTDLPCLGAVGFREPLLYVAASRARHRLVLVPCSDEAESELKQLVAGCDGG